MALVPIIVSLLQVSREHYLRDDIWSGTSLDPESDLASNKLSATAKHYLVVDTNVALSQVSILHETCSMESNGCAVISIPEKTLH